MKTDRLIKPLQSMLILVVILIIAIAINWNSRNDCRQVIKYLEAYHIEDAIEKGNSKKVKFLVNLNSRISNIELDDDFNSSPSFVAVSLGKVEILRILIKNGANVNSTNKINRTLLSEAIINTGHIEYSNPQNKGGTKNGELVKHNNMEMVKILLQNGANVDTKSGSGWGGNENFVTPLFIAVNLGNKDIVRLLLKNGAAADDDSIVNGKRKSSLLLAREKGDNEMIEILEKHSKASND